MAAYDDVAKRKAVAVKQRQRSDIVGRRKNDAMKRMRANQLRGGSGGNLEKMPTTRPGGPGNIADKLRTVPGNNGNTGGGSTAARRQALLNKLGAARSGYYGK